MAAVFTLFRVTASEAAVLSAAWLAAGGMVAVVVGAGDVEDVMTPVVVAVAAVVVLAVAATVGTAVLAFAVVTDFAVVDTTVVAVVATTVAVVATTVVAVATTVVAGVGAVGSEEGVPVTAAVSSSRLSTPALFRYACNM